MIVATECNAWSGVVHALDDEPCITKNGGQAPTQSNLSHSERVGHYNLLERREEEVDSHNAVKESDKMENLS